MGIYEGQYENPCPRCGGVVYTIFISVGAMSFWMECSECHTKEYTPEEIKKLGENKSKYSIYRKQDPNASWSLPK